MGGAAVDGFVDGIIEAAASALGRPIPTGTTIVPVADRTGSHTAVAYPFADRTVVWCDPHIASDVERLSSHVALGVDDFVERATALGGEVVGFGHNRVMNGEPSGPSDPPAGYDAVSLDRSTEEDRQRLEAFIAEFTDDHADDLDEAELEMETLDPNILVLVNATGAIAGYASGRDWDLGENFDDIGVIVHPDHRRLGLGASVVREFARLRLADGARLLYRCDVDNAGSNRLAESVGFELVNRMAAVRFNQTPRSAP